MFEDLDQSEFQASDPNPKEMEFIHSIRPQLEKVAPDYVAFRDKFGWGHIGDDITFYEWMADMATYLREGFDWGDVAEVDAWIIGDMDGTVYGICKSTGDLISISAGDPRTVDREGRFEAFIRRFLE